MISSAFTTDPDYWESQEDETAPEMAWLGQLRSAEDIARNGVPPVEFDVDHLMESTGGPVLLFGAPETFKSWLALFIAIAIINGEKFMQWFAVKQRPFAIYVNLDAGRSAMERRIALTGCAHPKLLAISPECWDWDEFEALLNCTWVRSSSLTAFQMHSS